MGIYISGGMIVGAHSSKYSIPDGIEDIYDWLDENKMHEMCDHYDAGFGESYFGFRVNNIPVPEMGGEWLDNVRLLAKKFTELTGLEARLIGTQDVS